MLAEVARAIEAGLREDGDEGTGSTDPAWESALER
jgi:hypothetical protein